MRSAHHVAPNFSHSKIFDLFVNVCVRVFDHKKCLLQKKRTVCAYENFPFKWPWYTYTWFLHTYYIHMALYHYFKEGLLKRFTTE